MTTGYIDGRVFEGLLGCLTEDNALCLRVMAVTGMRISDALSMRWKDLPLREEATELEYTYTEQKTKKKRTVRLPAWLCAELENRRAFMCWWTDWVFPGRDSAKHRTRQAVWKDLARAAKLYRVSHKRLKAHIGTHTARKIYAVELYRRMCEEGLKEPLEAVRMDLNHADQAVTYLYALADVITDQRSGQKAG